MRSGKKADIKWMMGFKRTLEDALEKMPDYEGKVWRGADLPKRIFDKIKIWEVSRIGDSSARP